MASPVPSRLRAAGIGPRPGGKQGAPARSTTTRREQLRPTGRRLQQSDLEASRGGNREEVRRDLAKGRDLFEPGQPVLARTRTVHFQAFWLADAAASAPDHDDLQRGS